MSLFEGNNNFNEYNYDLDKTNYMISRLETKYKSEEVYEESQNNFIKDSLKNEKILILEIITSSLDTKGKKIIINPKGYNLGLRQANDGTTIFGYEDPKKNEKKVRNKFLIFIKEINRLYNQS